MGWHRNATRIKVEAESGTVLTLPVWSIEVTPEEFVPDGGTTQERYDGSRYYVSPTFGYSISIQYDYERTDVKAVTWNTLRDVLDLFEEDAEGYVDVYVRYDESSGTYDSDYVLNKMIPDIQGDTLQIIFNEKAREKERELILRSQDKNNAYSSVRWMFD